MKCKVNNVKGGNTAKSAIKKYFLHFCVMMLSAIGVIGQQPEIPNIIPPSPNAASLGKYGDIPVGYYTGTANISIPVYSVKVGKANLPITLSYHTQGLKVEEKASWVGLNWSLSAGGVITRSIKGGPDEDAGYWNYAGWTKEYVAADYTRTLAFCNGSYDTQPDMFYFNFLGFSGKFVIDGAAPHDIHLIPFSNLKITCTSTLSSFEVVDENGIKYIFDAIETTTDDNNPPTIRYYKSAWYLTKIVSPAGEINLTYTNDNSFFSQFSEVSHAVSEPNANASHFKPAYQGMYADYEIASKVLSEINTPDCKIKFLSVLDRQDMSQAARLQTIQVENKNGGVIKKFKFFHSYFGSTSTTDGNLKRLKLDMLSELSPDESLTKSHSFTYNSPELVPSVKSLSQDAWGFFNGKINSSLLIPLSPYEYGSYVANQATLFGDRSPDYASSVVGTLKFITYPTGGQSEFVYEANSYGYANGAAVNEQERTNQQVLVQAKINSTTNIPQASQNFTIGEGQTVEFYLQGSYLNPPPVEDGPSIIISKILPNGTKTTVYQRVLLNTTESIFQFLETGTYEAKASVDGNNQSSSVTVKYYSLSGTIIKTKTAGGVRIRQIKAIDPIGNLTQIKNYTYTVKTDAARSSGVLAGQPSFVDDKWYTYGTSSAYKVRTSSSSNYLATTQGSHIGYSMVTETETGAGGNGKKEYYYLSGIDYPNIFGANFQITALNSITSLSQYSRKYMTDYDVCRGLISKEMTYKEGASTAIEEIQHNYNLPEALDYVLPAPNYSEINYYTGTYYRLCVINCAQCDCLAPSCGTCETYGLDRFFLTSTKVIIPWIYKKSMIKKETDNSGNIITNTENYFYDNAVHGKITRVEQTSSKGASLKSVFKYPSDKQQIANLTPTTSAAIDEMITNHILGRVIETEKYSNNSILNRSRTDYRIWNVTKKIIEPEYVKTQTLTNPLVDRIQFFRYDEFENLMEASKLSDVREVYLWGYNNQYPVAKIVGADYATSVALVNQTILTNANGTYSDAQMRTELNNLRTGLPGAMVTTYTYKPLIGITSETDSRGKTMYYEYDPLGRLLLIKDQDGNIIKVFDYKYQQ